MVTVHYLPKYYLPPDALIWPEISLMDAKRFGFECSKWKVTHCPLLQPCPLKPRFEPELCIAIPKTAQALSKTCSIINVQITAPPELLDTYVKRTSIQMIRKTTLTVMGESHSSHSGVIAKGCIQQIESELAGPNSRIIRAGVKGGVTEGEASWQVDNLIGVEVRPLPISLSYSFAKRELSTSFGWSSHRKDLGRLWFSTMIKLFRCSVTPRRIATHPLKHEMLQHCDYYLETHSITTCNP